jgi:hypothetical protein
MSDISKFVKVYKNNDLFLYFQVDHRHPEWLKLCLKTWLINAKNDWHSPGFWLIVTPRYIARLIWLAIKNP